MLLNLWILLRRMITDDITGNRSLHRVGVEFDCYNHNVSIIENILAILPNITLTCLPAYIPNQGIVTLRMSTVVTYTYVPVSLNMGTLILIMDVERPSSYCIRHNVCYMSWCHRL